MTVVEGIVETEGPPDVVEIDEACCIVVAIDVAVSVGAGGVVTGAAAELKDELAVVIAPGKPAMPTPLTVDASVSALGGSYTPKIFTAQFRHSSCRSNTPCGKAKIGRYRPSKMVLHSGPGT